MSKVVTESIKSLLYPSDVNYKLFFKSSHAECYNMLISHVLFTYIRLSGKQGHIIISADMDESIITYCRAAMDAKLCSVSVINLDENLLIDVKLLAAKVRENTLLIILPLVAASGAINNIELISLLAKKNEIPLCCNIDNLFPFQEIHLSSYGIDVFTYCNNFSKSNLIYPQFDLAVSQTVCTMGVWDKVIAGYKLDLMGPNSDFTKSTLHMVAKSLIVYSSANLKEYQIIKSKLLAAFPPTIETIPGVIFLPSEIKITDRVKLVKVGDKFVLIFPIDLTVEEIETIIKMNKKK